MQGIRPPVAGRFLGCRIKNERDDGKDQRSLGRGHDRIAPGRNRNSVGLLSSQDTREVRRQLQAMLNPVKLVHFTQELNLEYGRETRMLLQEVAALSVKLSLDVHDYLLDQDQVAAYKVNKVPATVIRNAKDYGIRFYGLPGGYEFVNLLDAVLAVSQGDSGVSDSSREKLKTLSQPIHLEVFVTPT